MEGFYQYAPFVLERKEKRNLLLDRMRELTKFHYENCQPYRQITDALLCNPADMEELEDIPYIPVRLFKEYELYSVPKEEIVKVITSSGTTGQVSSQIFLDKYTAQQQNKVLVKIVADFIGGKRMPMLVLDCPDVVKNREMFTTRGAGILGFSVFGTEKVYALNSDMSINEEAVSSFMQKQEGKTILLFGFTFIIWKHVLLELEQKQTSYDWSKAVMVHGGGWKKLISEAVSKEEFKERFRKVTGLRRIHENYGMAEQTGSIYMECECGHLHVSQYSDVIMRRPIDMSPCEIGEKGIMQVLSAIPRSYPGHSLLTEDEGIILGEDDCPCGRKGKYFQVLGRLKNAEIRGCSDTYADKLR